MTVGILKFRKSEPDGALLCEYANKEAVRVLGESVGRSWNELSATYNLPVHFEEKTLTLPAGKLYKVTRQTFEPFGFVLTLTDLTAESRSNKEMEDLLHIASHDLQEPLRKVISFGERIAKNKASLGEENNLYLSRMMNATTRMQKMLSGLLVLSRVGQVSVSLESVDLAEIVRDAFQSASQQIPRHSVKFVADGLPVLKANKEQMFQLFEEIFLNSLRFQPENHAIEIKVDSEVNLPEKQVTIEIVDNGIGFDNEHAERIFLLFSRLNGRADFEGSGIGLAICKKIVEKHDGKIRASSLPGKRTTIEIVLPLASDL